MMGSLSAFTVIVATFAIGDLISYKTKSIVSMMFVASILFLVAFWLGLPPTIFEDSQMTDFGSLMIALLITHMGTMLSLKDLKKQWKTVLVALAAVIGIAVFIFFIGTPIIGREYAIAAAPPISGGVVAAIIMSEGATQSVAIFTTLLVVTQGFLGYPIASICLNKEVKKILKEYRENGKTPSNQSSIEAAIAKETIEKSKKKLFKPLSEELQTSYVLLAKLALVAVLGVKLAEFTNGIIHQYVMCLMVGVVAREIGFLEESIMNKANAFGLAMIGLMSIVFAGLAGATPQTILSLSFPIFVSLILGVIGIAIFSSIIGKFLGYSKEMSTAIGASALFGFPGTFIISNEVANANSTNEEEKKWILDKILPEMLVAGFITVTIASVLLAGFMVKLM